MVLAFAYDLDPVIEINCFEKDEPEAHCITPFTYATGTPFPRHIGPCNVRGPMHVNQRGKLFSTPLAASFTQLEIPILRLLKMRGEQPSNTPSPAILSLQPHPFHFHS